MIDPETPPAASRRPPAASHHPARLRDNRPFLLLWSGQAVSTLGSAVSATAMPLLVLGLTGSAASAGLVGFAATLPQALLQLPAGAAVDRWDRKRVMVVCDAGRCLALGALVAALLLGRAGLPLLVAAAFAEGAFAVFFGLAETAAVRHVVPDAHLGPALAQNEARVRGASFAGRPLGGVLYGLGQAVPFVADLVSYVVSLGTLLLLPGRFAPGRTAPPQRFDREVREGVAWLWAQPFLRTCALLVAASNFAFEALVLALIVLAGSRGAGPAEIGLMLGGFGAGGLLGAAVAPWAQARVAPRTVVVGSTWVWALLAPLLAVAPGIWALAAVAGAMAFVGPLWNVALGTYGLLLTPPELLGRVTSVSRLLAFGAIPLGSLAGGVLLQRAGPVATVAALAGWMLLVALAATAAPSVRRAPRTT